MSEREEEENIPICYIAGTIRLNVTPPDGFDVVPKVLVDGVEAYVRQESTEQPLTWRYLAIVQKGKHVVKMMIDNIVSERSMHVKPATTARLNFNLTEAA
ncbi:hypothetical protein MUP77_22175 [Candidatus Bathyarchaeota archaeon]|nr:hypothetical protein [Candidatus Bathyarchaeota archaeon]